MRTAPVPLLSPFGWSVAGALMLGLSLPPAGIFPLAWVALVPILVRWSLASSMASYAREAYAVFLVLTASAGCWMLFHPDAGRAALSGIGLLVAPLPLAAALTLAIPVRLRLGVPAGLAAVAVNVLAVEFLLLHIPGGMPWFLLGYTQATAGVFAQPADLGGVLLLSAWVLALNVATFAALPPVAARAAARAHGPDALARTGLPVAAFAVLLVAPVLYGAVRGADEQPVGFLRTGVVQAGVTPSAWDRQSPVDRVDYLAELSADLIERWDGSGAARDREQAAGLLIWPQDALPDMGDRGQTDRLLARLGAWAGREHVDLLAGATLASTRRREAWEALPAGDLAGNPAGTAARAAAQTEDPDLGSPGSAAVLVGQGRVPARYDQIRRMPVADALPAPGSRRVLFESGGAHVAALIGYESMFGEHMAGFAREGADAYVLLSRSDWWGRAGGTAHHLAAARLRAIESRRSVVVTTVSGGTALIDPMGAATSLGVPMRASLVPIDVPLYRTTTFYMRHGDWVGLGALCLSLLGFAGLALASRFVPLPVRAPAPRASRAA